MKRLLLISQRASRHLGSLDLVGVPAGTALLLGHIISNVLRVVLLPEETVDLVGKFIYQITIQDISGEIEIPDQGIIRIANNINKSFPH